MSFTHKFIQIKWTCSETEAKATQWPIRQAYTCSRVTWQIYSNLKILQFKKFHGLSPTVKKDRVKNY